jgi:hypothetical protein
MFLSKASEWLPSALKRLSPRIVHFEEEEKFKRRFAAEMRGRKRRALTAPPVVVPAEEYGPIALPEPLVPLSYIGRSNDVVRKDNGEWAERVAGNQHLSAFIFRSLLRTINDPRIPASLTQLSRERQPMIYEAVRCIRNEGHNNDQKVNIDLGVMPAYLLDAYSQMMEETQTLEPWIPFRYAVGNGPVWTALPPPYVSRDIDTTSTTSDSLTRTVEHTQSKPLPLQP